MDSPALDYESFLSAKVAHAASTGIEVDWRDVSPELLPHQQTVVQWAVRGGRRAIFASFGLGKTLVPEGRGGRGRGPDTVRSGGCMTFRHLPLTAIRVRRNTRKVMDPEGLRDLTESIRARGQLQPLIVRSAGGQYTLVAGHRRLAAQQSLGAKNVPCLILSGAETADPLVQLAENVQRENLTALEIVAAVDAIRAEHPGMTKLDAARAIGKTESWIQVQYRAANVRDKAIKAGADPRDLDRLPTAHIVRLGLAPPEARPALAAKAARENMSSRQLFDAARDAKAKGALRFASQQSRQQWTGRFGIFVHDETTLVVKLRVGDLVWATQTLKGHGGEIVAVKPLEPDGQRWGNGGRGKR